MYQRLHTISDRHKTLAVIGIIGPNLHGEHETERNSLIEGRSFEYRLR